MTETEFLQHYIPNAAQIMWFLGAGTSRSAGMPTATDLIWDLKLRYYCIQENQDIERHDIDNEAIKKRIQAYMESKEFPSLWSPEEYSFYFELIFGSDYSAQRKFLAEKLDSQLLSLNIGHRSLGGLIALNKARVIFTTNFDEVIEQAYSKVSGKNLSAFHLEGSYAALDALNSETFPIYAKVHGDFKYQSIKNLSLDLVQNDKKIQDCFIAACSRYGLIVTGYSGRDENVMSMFSTAIQQHNAFPLGIFWTVTSLKGVSGIVTDFIKRAQGLGINAHIVETGTFDSLLSKIWRQIPDKGELDKKVRTSIAMQVNIPLPGSGQNFPVLRTNALPILELPQACAIINTVKVMSIHDVKGLVIANRPNAIITKTDLVIGWGDEEELIKGLGRDQIESIGSHNFENSTEVISKSTIHHSFFERALVTALCSSKPIRLKNNDGFYLIVDYQKVGDSIFDPLKEALSDFNGKPGQICGQISNTPPIYWSEAINVKLEERNGTAYLMLRPTIWIEPKEERQNQIDFIKIKRSKRYNRVTSNILDAWIKILFGSIGTGGSVDISCFDSSKFPIKFKISTRTAFSRK